MSEIFHSLTSSLLPVSFLVINVAAIYYLCKAILIAAGIVYGVIATLLGKEQ